MTETDATNRPLVIPERFSPYLDKYKIYRTFKDMLRDLVINLPKDHLKHMKIFLNHRIHSSRDVDRVIILISPDLNIDVKKVVKDMIKDLGFFVITRRCVMDQYEKHDDYVPGCISPVLMSEVVKTMTCKDPVLEAGWLMFDHPCTVREARCMQQDGILPTVTLVLIPTPPVAESAHNPRTPRRSFFNQDFEGLKYAYKATLKEVYIESDDDYEKVSTKCFNAIRACSAGAQGPGQGYHVVGAPGVYRVLILGPRGSGRRTQAKLLAKHFGLIDLHSHDLYNEAKVRNDDTGERLRKYGLTLQLKIDIIKRRILQKDCIDYGWVLTGFPQNGMEFEYLDNMPTPPNRIIFLNVDMDTCKKRAVLRGVNWCTGEIAPLDFSPNMLPHPDNSDKQLDNELDQYFSECLAELRAAAGITAVEINNLEPIDTVQVRIRAAVIAAPAFDIESCNRLRNVCAD